MGYLIFRAKLPTPYFLGYGCGYYGRTGANVHTHKYIHGTETQITLL